jgi:hypothetical protein
VAKPKVCERCKAMYSDHVTICPKDGTHLNDTHLIGSQVDEVTLVLKRDDHTSVASDKPMDVRSLCKTCFNVWPGWLQHCPQDNGHIFVSIGGKYQVFETLTSDEYMSMFRAREDLSDKPIFIIVLEHTSAEINAELSTFFTKAASLHEAELMNIGLLEDGRPYAVCSVPISSIPRHRIHPVAEPQQPQC